MAQTNFTPISLYYSATATNVPSAANLVAGELAINTQDGKLFYKDAAGVVQTIASKDTNSGTFVNLAYTGTLTGGTGIVNLGSGQFYKDASGNVGLGTTSPIRQLQVGNFSGGGGEMVLGSSTSGNGSIYFGDGATGVDFYRGFVQYQHNGDNMLFGTASSERMRIDSSGNVGIGTSSPAGKLHISGTSGAGSELRLASTTSGTTGSVKFYEGATAAWELNTTGANGSFYIKDSFNNAERMRITPQGALCVGTTTATGTVKFVVESDTTTVNPMTVSNTRSTAATDFAILFYRAGNIVGSVQTSLSATSFVTSSDYRLKENIAPMIGALAKVALLKPVTYDWKTGGSSQGFIAHELQEVIPEAVAGEKDAVNEDGSIKAQGIDTSFLVATLTAAIQELKATVDAQAARIAALESK
jgi:hypothetical protein